MFNLFKKNKNPICPIPNDIRLWMENSFLWLATQFGHDNICEKETILPNKDYFPFKYDGSAKSLFQTAEIVAEQMEIDASKLNLKVYKQNIQEVQNEFGNFLFTEVDSSLDNPLSSGLYFGLNENGKI